MRHFLRIVAALLLSVPAAAAQQPLETRGTWPLVPDGADFALRTGAVGAADTTLSLSCRKEQQGYVLTLKSPALAGRASGDDIRIKVDVGDQTFFNLTTGPDGTLPISHQTAFWIMYPALTRSDAKAVAFTAADHSWQFSLDGLRDLTAALSERCGLELAQPEPKRPQAGPAAPGR
jgi:hypothetical protein